MSNLFAVVVLLFLAADVYSYMKLAQKVKKLNDIVGLSDEVKEVKK